MKFRNLKKKLKDGLETIRSYTRIYYDSDLRSLVEEGYIYAPDELMQEKISWKQFKKNINEYSFKVFSCNYLNKNNQIWICLFDEGNVIDQNIFDDIEI